MSAPYDPWIRPITQFDGVRDHPVPADRLRAVRSASRAFREEMLDGPEARYYRSVELIRVPYPTKYGLRDACALPTPYMHICNRMFVVQFDTDDGLKTLLVSPSDIEGNRATPFFARLADSFGPLEGPLSRLLGPSRGTVPQWLERLGISPADVDYITYDHLHTQDVRKWLGSQGKPGLFPNARLLVMREEWDAAQGLLPPQSDWYCPAGTYGVDPERVLCLDGSVMLGESVALIHTPGHTEGNHSIVVHTPEGLMVTSENGVGPDAYAPLHSEIPGVARFSMDTGMEVILNGNTLERGLDQYISMILEKEVAGPSRRNPDFYNVVCSSEFDAYWMFPGLKPTFRFGDLEFGTLTR